MASLSSNCLSLDLNVLLFNVLEMALSQKKSHVAT